MSRYRTLISQRVATYLSLALVRLLPRLEAAGKLQGALVALTQVARRIPTLRYQKVQLDQLREAFESEHPALDIARRLASDVNPKYLRTVLHGLWTPLWMNGQTRTEFLAREGFEPPLLVVISPLKQCNLQCEGCYASAVTTKDEPILDFETMDRIVSELGEFGTSFIVLSGGEPTHPLIWPTIKRLCAKHSDRAFMMYTNGTLIDDQKVRDLTKLGNLSPAISVEGWREQTDERRGSGVYDKIMAAMDRLRKAGVLFGFSVTYTRKNFDVVTDGSLIDHLMKMGCMYGWYFMYVPVGKEPNLDLIVTPAERDEIRRFTWDILRRKGLFIADFWNSGPMTKGCIAGGRYLHIDNRGQIEPCVFFKFTSHNIRDTKIIEALRSPLFAEIRKGQARTDNPLTPCQFMDNPLHGRSAASLPGVRPSTVGGEVLFCPETLQFLKEWSSEYRERYADPAWTKSGEYSWFEHVYTDPCWLKPAGSRACCLESPVEERATVDA